MHPRIKLIDGTNVEIQRTDDPKATAQLYSPDDGVLGARAYYDGSNTTVVHWDAPAREALRLASRCLDDTGSFAALADDHPGLYVGKVMPTRGGGTAEYLGPSGEQMHSHAWRHSDGRIGFHLESGAWWLDNDPADVDILLPSPEPPAPKYRAHTPETALELLGQRVALHGETGTVVYVGAHHVKAKGCARWSYDDLLKATLLETGEPCGVRED